MAPIRRYLRITKQSVLEVRIYLDNPLLAQTWLLNPRTKILARVIEAIRPLVLPKLREENERSKGKGGAKKKGVKDVITEEDFEVSIFLTDTSTRHSILSKQKIFRDKDKPLIKSNSSKLTGDTNDEPIDVDNAEGEDGVLRERSNVDKTTPVVLREESDDEGGLDQIPIAVEIMEVNGEEGGRRRSKRQRTTRQDGDDDNSDGSLFAEGTETDSDVEDRPSKRSKTGGDAILIGDDDAEDTGGDEKKKMAMETRYDGFAIYGRVLCLVVKQRNANKGRGRPGFGGGGAAMMEDYIRSTQAPAGEEDDG